MVVAFSGCGSGGGHDPAPFTLKDVEHVFAAHGERLTDALYPRPPKQALAAKYHEVDGFTATSDQDLTLAVVRVWNRPSALPGQKCLDASRAPGAPCSDLFVGVGNVFVEFDPNGARAGQVRAAITELRRSPRLAHYVR